MKKRGVFFALLLVFILSLFLAGAVNETAETKAYSCLEAKVKDQCDTLSAEEKAFSLLTIERCKSELVAASFAQECWPDTGCEIKTTAQAILVLKHVNTDTTLAENWLLSKTGNFADIDWFLQVDSSNKTTCTITYTENTYSFTIEADKTLTANDVGCFEVESDYWLKISPTCYDYEFKISCKNSFLTSLLYRKQSEQSIKAFYLSKKTTTAPGEGTTTEKVSASCFKFADGNYCDYEGTLWAAFVMKTRGDNVSSYVPYLVVTADENTEYLPEAFLYSLTGNFKTELLAKQQESSWWLVSGDKFYDTAVALLPFQGETIAEKTNSKTWFSEVQDDDGCWQGNIRNTALILYSLWPKKSSTTTAKDCENSGYTCMSSAECLDIEGSVLSDYTGCFTNVCCSKQESKTCSEQDGELCDSDKSCIDGRRVSASDASAGKTCCVDGECGIQEQSECEIAGGYCRSICLEGEEFEQYLCDSGNCCIAKEKSNLWMIILLIILILLVVLGIIFRKKLRDFFVKLKFKFGKKKPGKPTGSQRFPPVSSRRTYPGAVQRRILPPQSRVPARRPTTQGKSEFDDILKKLKEIGK